ncbi:MAG: DUF6273 domain-containing protein [Clostridiales Family XIII bacterium]|nr:DUF6273 domain-containing protein [Clostridiales Family XIII bacterium]
MRDGSGKALQIGDIAYDRDPSYGYTVYISEDGAFAPYLVLARNYGGSVLLLREEPLEAPMAYNDYAGYYEGSSIDAYLCGSFLDSLQPEVKGSIRDSEITITAESSLGVAGSDVKTIVRKVFLLSYTEIGQASSSVANVEGRALKYFKEPSHVIAYKGGEAASWWLRTSYTWYGNSAWGVGPEGSLGGGAVYEPNGIRPAFCVDGSLRIAEGGDSADGADGFYVDVEEGGGR